MRIAHLPVVQCVVGIGAHRRSQLSGCSTGTDHPLVVGDLQDRHLGAEDFGDPHPVEITGESHVFTDRGRTHDHGDLIALDHLAGHVNGARRITLRISHNDLDLLVGDLIVDLLESQIKSLHHQTAGHGQIPGERTDVADFDDVLRKGACHDHQA